MAEGGKEIEELFYMRRLQHIPLVALADRARQLHDNVIFYQCARRGTRRGGRRGAPELRCLIGESEGLQTGVELTG